jgi:hypothetical protein
MLVLPVFDGDTKVAEAALYVKGKPNEMALGKVLDNIYLGFHAEVGSVRGSSAYA